MKRRLLCLVLLVAIISGACASPPNSGTESTKPSATVLPTISNPTEQPTTPDATEQTNPSATESTVDSTAPPATEPSLEPTLAPTEEPTAPAPVYTICIDAGHQQRGIAEKEPNGPGSSDMKAKLTSGTQGIATGIPEYQLNLDVSLMLEQELLARGYNVVMIRRTNDCPLSNAERATVANESGADIFIRIHANGSDNPAVNGMLCCAPTKNNPYLSAQNIAESIRLSNVIVDRFCAKTGAKNKGLYSVDTMTGINWCSIPVTIVEMGFMSNPEEDRKMATTEYRKLMVQGIADGIDAYFES